MRLLTVSLLAFLTWLPAARAAATPADASFLAPTTKNPWQIDWLASAAETQPRAMLSWRVPDSAFAQDAQPLHAAAVEHSEAYQMRAKIHKYASFATLPLFATELALGQSVYNNGSSSGKKGAHIAVGAGIVSLFAVNSATGLWNMFGAEGRREKEGRTLRLVHGLLMLAADAGFVATMATAPGDGEGRGFNNNFNSNRSTHRAIAVTSIGLGSAGYLSMLFGNH